MGSEYAGSWVLADDFHKILCLDTEFDFRILRFLPAGVLYLFGIMFYNLSHQTEEEIKWQKILLSNTGLMIIGMSVC